MKITARVENSKGNHQGTWQTNDSVHSIVIPPKPTGYGSSTNGGDPALDVTCHAKVSADTSEDEIREMMKFTDTVAEIQNTLRNGTNEVLTKIDAVKI